MNAENLHELIQRYEDDLENIYGLKHYELFKWEAMKTWQDEWTKPADSFSSFAERFNAARKNFSLFIDSSRMHPSTGVVKLWEREPDSIEHLFYNVLFADAQGDVAAVQSHMDDFIDGYEALRQKFFPGNWSYKQDRHSASVFLAMNDPGFNYVYKSSEALTMARYIDFRTSIGSGSSFSLPNYYMLCEEIVDALRQHPSLLEKHFNKLSEHCYRDDSLHLLAFDLMYCSRTYNYYLGLPIPAVWRRGKALQAELYEAERAQKEERRLAQIAALEQEIEELQRTEDGCEDISLIGVQVSSVRDGVGIVVD